MKTLNKIPIIRILLVVIVSTFTNSCNNDFDTLNIHSTISITQAKSIFEKFKYESTDRKVSVSTLTTRTDVMSIDSFYKEPDWNNAVSYFDSLKNQNVIEVPIKANYFTFYSIPSNGLYIQPTTSDHFTKKSLIIVKDANNNNINVAVCNILASSGYYNSGKMNSVNNYRIKDPDFSGLVVYTDWNDNILSGYEFSNGIFNGGILEGIYTRSGPDTIKQLKLRWTVCITKSVPIYASSLFNANGIIYQAPSWFEAEIIGWKDVIICFGGNGYGSGEPGSNGYGYNDGGFRSSGGWSFGSGPGGFLNESDANSNRKITANKIKLCLGSIERTEADLAVELRKIIGNCKTIPNNLFNNLAHLLKIRNSEEWATIIETFLTSNGFSQNCLKTIFESTNCINTSPNEFETNFKDKTGIDLWNDYPDYMEECFGSEDFEKCIIKKILNLSDQEYLHSDVYRDLKDLHNLTPFVEEQQQPTLFLSANSKPLCSEYIKLVKSNSTHTGNNKVLVNYGAYLEDFIFLVRNPTNTAITSSFKTSFTFNVEAEVNGCLDSQSSLIRGCIAYAVNQTIAWMEANWTRPPFNSNIQSDAMVRAYKEKIGNEFRTALGVACGYSTYNYAGVYFSEDAPSFKTMFGSEAPHTIFDNSFNTICP